VTSGSNDQNGKSAPERASAARSLPRRFFELADYEQRPEGWLIVLDGRPVKTPCKASLVLPSKALARAVAQEWAAQGETIDPETMLLTKLANTAIDRVKGREGEVAQEIAGYASSDLLCYRADSPQELAELQGAIWDPVLEWAASTLAARFQRVAGVVHVAQPEETLAAVGRAIEAFDAFGLTGLHNMTTLTGSCLLALAYGHRHLTAEQAWHAALVDEDWQISQWGEDREARERREKRWGEFVASCRFLDLCRAAD